ncbi:MAG: hypothetical protein U0271_08570 [Polyangiaceae bacterium]
MDPAIVALAQPALACKFEDGRFLDCEAADAFRMSRDPALSGEAAERALFAMLFASDERLRLLARSRFTQTVKPALLDKANVAKLLAGIETETNTEIRDGLAAIAGEADFEKLGLRAELEHLAASEKVAVRRSLAYRLLFHETSPLAFEIVGKLSADADEAVRKSAATGLSNAVFSPTSPACELLAKALASPHGDDFVWAAGGSERCKDLQDKALGFVEGRVKRPKEITDSAAVDYTLALDSVCSDPHARGVMELPSPSAETRRRAFDAALAMTSAEISNASARSAAIGCLVACDPKRARPELEKLLKDDALADAAKKALGELAKAAK